MKKIDKMLYKGVKKNDRELIEEEYDDDIDLSEYTSIDDDWEEEDDSDDEEASEAFKASLEINDTNYHWEDDDDDDDDDNWDDDDDNDKLPSFTDEFGVEYSHDKKRLISAINIPATLTSYTVLEGVEIIEQGAFSYCSMFGTCFDEDYQPSQERTHQPNHQADILADTLPDTLNVQEEGGVKFYGCHALESIILPSTLIKIGNYAFADCKGLKHIRLPDGVKKIPWGAFIYCTALESVDIPNSVKKIDDYAFAYCLGLLSIELPNSVKKMGKGVFSGCTFLEKVTLPNTLKALECEVFKNCASLNDITFPRSIERIEEEAFYKCNLKAVHFPKSLEDLSGSAFAFNQELSSIYFEGNNFQFCDGMVFNHNKTMLIMLLPTTPIPYKLLASAKFTLGVNAFCYRVFEKELTLSMASISKFTPFRHCRFKGKVRLPQKLRKINRLFYDCQFEKELILPSYLKIFDSLQKCIFKQELILPDSLRSIRAYCFRECQFKNNELTIPESVVKIDTTAFDEVYLEKINIKGDTFYYRNGGLYQTKEIEIYSNDFFNEEDYKSFDWETDINLL